MNTTRLNKLLLNIKKYVTLKNALIAVIGCSLLIIGFLLWHRSTPEEDSTEPYILLDTKVDLGPTHVFTIPAPYKAGSKVNSDDNAIAVYSDPELTKRLSTTNDYDVDTEEVKIAPPLSEVTNLHDTRSAKNVTEWALYDVMYLAQRIDLQSGKELKKPIVTPFTIKRQLATPDVAQAVTPEGSLTFSWRPVPGAAKYYIVSVEEHVSYGATTHRYAKIAETTATTWSSSAEDKPLSATQNSHFRSGAVSEDDKRDPTHQLRGSKDMPSPDIYTVIAVRGDELSNYQAIDAAIIRSQLPVTVAGNAYKELNGSDGNLAGFDSIEKIPTTVPITMADGRTVLKSILIQPENTSFSDRIVSDGSTTRHEQALKVPYTIAGTKLSYGYFSIDSYNPAVYQADLQRIAKRNIEAQAPTGQNTQYKYIGVLPDLKAQFVASKTKPQVPYPISTSNPFSSFLAAHLIKGTEYIDVSQYIGKAGSPQLEDALLEARLQNPFVVDFGSYFYYNDKKLLRIFYVSKDAGERQKEQQTINEAADRVIQTELAGKRSDRDKALAINNYLIKHATYDYETLDALKKAGPNGLFVGRQRSYNASGVLIDKLGVCASYAAAFQLLAQKAGLQSAYVTGIAQGDNHAWNKVRIDGIWKIVDVTWNDSEGDPQKFFGLSEKQASETRTQSKDFMMDAKIKDYNAQ